MLDNRQIVPDDRSSAGDGLFVMRNAFNATAKRLDLFHESYETWSFDNRNFLIAEFAQRSVAA